MIREAEPSPQRSGPEALLSDRVRAVLPVVAERAREGEALRRMPEATMDLLREIGWWRAIVPRMYCGLEADLYDWVQAVRLLCSVDMATGWTAGLLGCHTHGLALFPKTVQDELWGSSPDTIIVSAGAPSPDHAKTVERVAGGYLLTSRHGFSSGSTYADWAVTLFTGPDPSTGEPTSLRGVVPRADFKVEDTWFAAGMKGTGSNDVIFDGTFVPDEHCLRMRLGDEERGPDIHDNPMYRLSFMSIYNYPFGAFMLGGMEGALQVAEEAMKHRVRASLYGKTSLEHLPSQLRLAETKMDALAAALVAEDRWRGLCAVAAEGRLETLEEFKLWRAQDVYVARTALRGVDRLMGQAGPSANRDEYPLQRFWRDMHVAAQHPYLEPDGAYQVYARQVLGLPRDPTLRFS